MATGNYFKALDLEFQNEAYKNGRYERGPVSTLSLKGGDIHWFVKGQRRTKGQAIAALMKSGYRPNIKYYDFVVNGAANG